VHSSIHWFSRSACSPKNHDEPKKGMGEGPLKSNVFAHQSAILYPVQTFPKVEKPNSFFVAKDDESPHW
jgi:hypothetical protein